MIFHIAMVYLSYNLEDPLLQRAALANVRNLAQTSRVLPLFYDNIATERFVRGWSQLANMAYSNLKVHLDGTGRPMDEPEDREAQRALQKVAVEMALQDEKYTPQGPVEDMLKKYEKFAADLKKAKGYGLGNLDVDVSKMYLAE